MNQQYSPESMQWSDLSHRTTHYGLELILRKSLVDEHISTVAITPNGEVVEFADKKAVEAFNHPAVTPGITERSVDVVFNPWDRALDELNDLPEDQQAASLEKFRLMFKGNTPTPTFLIEAVSRARRKHLPRAA